MPSNLYHVLRKDSVMNADWYRAGKATKCGFNYTAGTILLLTESEEEMPSFGEVCEVFCQGNEKVVLTVQKLTTVAWRPELNGYHVEGSNIIDSVELNMLKEPWPLPAYTVNCMKVVVNRFTMYINTP